MVPKQMRETLRPVVPSRTYCMGRPPRIQGTAGRPCGQGCSRFAGRRNIAQSVRRARASLQPAGLIGQAEVDGALGARLAHETRGAPVVMEGEAKVLAGRVVPPTHLDSRAAERLLATLVRAVRHAAAPGLAGIAQAGM